MAFGTKTKIETADQIRSAVNAALEALRNDPELVKARTAYEAAQRVATEANARVSEGEAALHALAMPLVPEGQALLTRLTAIEARIAKDRRTMAEIQAGPENYSKPTKLARLRESIGALERELGDAQHLIAVCRQRPTEQLLLAAPVDHRRAYRAAESAIVDARVAAKATVEPLQDAKQDLERARAAATQRARPALLQLRGAAIRRFNAALELAKQENELLAHIDGRINGSLGAGAVSPVTWREFDDSTPGYTSRLTTWRDSLRVNAPEAEISA